MCSNFLNASPLIQAVLFGDSSAVKDAIWAPYAYEKTDVNESDHLKRSPLHAAAYFGQTQIAETLITVGARVNCRDSFWVTPLHLACYSGHKNMVDVLIKHDAIVNAIDKNWQTPLHVAVARNAIDCVRSLIPRISNINVTDREGRTCLHHAANNQLPEMVKLLVNSGCTVNACDKRWVFLIFFCFLCLLLDTVIRCIGPSSNQIPRCRKCWYCWARM